LNDTSTKATNLVARPVGSRPLIHELDPAAIAALRPDQLVWEYFRTQAVCRYDQEPTELKRHFVQINRLLKQHGIRVVLRSIHYLFHATDLPWPFSKGNRPTVDQWLKHFDALVPNRDAAENVAFCVVTDRRVIEAETRLKERIADLYKQNGQQNGQALLEGGIPCP
jgi:hypothetical protein